MADFKFIKFRSKQYKPTNFPLPWQPVYNILTCEFADTVTGDIVVFNSRDIDRPGSWDTDIPGGLSLNPHNFLQKLIKDGFDGKRDISNLVIHKGLPIEFKPGAPMVLTLKAGMSTISL